MSHVTSIVLTTSVMEARELGGEGAIEALNAWLEANGHAPMAEIAEHAGGTKMMECNVWAGAQNYLAVPAFVAACESAAWVEPENVCVAIHTHDHETIVHRPGKNNPLQNPTGEITP